jgi:hypothetical protein
MAMANLADTPPPTPPGNSARGKGRNNIPLIPQLSFVKARNAGGDTLGVEKALEDLGINGEAGNKYQDITPAASPTIDRIRKY